MRGPAMKKAVVLAIALGTLALAPPARATSRTCSAAAVPCTVQGGVDAGERHCSGIFTTFDGAPIDINVGFPPVPASGPDGDFPIVGVFHGWGGTKLGLADGEHAGVARRRLRRLLDERPRLGQLVRRHRHQAPHARACAPRATTT